MQFEQPVCAFGVNVEGNEAALDRNTLDLTRKKKTTFLELRLSRTSAFVILNMYYKHPGTTYVRRSAPLVTAASERMPAFFCKKNTMTARPYNLKLPGSIFFYAIYGKTIMSTRMLDASLLGVGTVLRLEREAWSMVKRPGQATNEYAPPPPVLMGQVVVWCAVF